MWTGSVTGSHADNQHGVASEAGLARFTLLPLGGLPSVLPLVGGCFLVGAGDRIVTPCLLRGLLRACP
jgi:hypothetical protein